MAAAIWWLRRDLRLEDNQALNLALSRVDKVFPLFIIDPKLMNHASPAREQFLINALASLDSGLRDRGSRLIIRRGNPSEELSKVFKETEAEFIVAERDITPFAMQRDQSISEHLPCYFTEGLTIHPISAILKPNSSPYQVYTPYMKAWKSLPAPSSIIPAPDKLSQIPQIFSEQLPDHTNLVDFPASEHEAKKRLAGFLSSAVLEYAESRNRLDLDGTSRLSPYLRFGLISARKAVVEIQKLLQYFPSASIKRNCGTWLNELIWREFYLYILNHNPLVLKMAFQENLRHIPWRDAPGELHAWREGLTGYPVVDAAMRQLRETGWMHNRARMITASFLTKDLLINWQEGEKWFMRFLVDGDPASNNGGWQWTAGTGTDAAPYFRIFNPVLQSRKFDPEGSYIRRWVPELENIPDKFIHAPWEMSSDIQESSQVCIGKDYPHPVVDHAFARDRALAAYKSSKNY